MTISNSSTILATDVNNSWDTPLSNLRRRDISISPYKQFTEIFTFNNIVATTPEYLRTIVYTPRTDVVVRSGRVGIVSTSAGVPAAGIIAIGTIPAQVIEGSTIVGGNIPKTLTATATSSTAATFGSGQTRFDLNAQAVFKFLAGDNIDIVVSTTNTTNNNIITVSLTFETIMVES